MTDQTPFTPGRGKSGSLIERADAMFDFARLAGGPAAPAQAPVQQAAPAAPQAAPPAPQAAPIVPPVVQAAPPSVVQPPVSQPPAAEEPAPQPVEARQVFQVPAAQPASPGPFAAPEPAAMPPPPAHMRGMADVVPGSVPEFAPAHPTVASAEAQQRVSIRPSIQPVQRVDRERLRERGFIIPEGPVTGLSEEFRIIKRQLLLAANGDDDNEPLEHGKRILVCSALPAEGKTYSSINLALSIAAERDNDVLLVDADFAKPSVLSSLGIQGKRGLMDALADPAVAIEDLIIQTDIPGLSVLPAGSRINNDTEILASSRTRSVLDRLTRNNPSRIVIFDSPPALAASPASELAMHVGQCVVVVRADKTTESALNDALSLLAGCDNIQLLLNGVRFSPTGRRFGSYYGYGE